MKANEAPERIWINPTIDLPKLCGPIDKDSVIYTRTKQGYHQAEKDLELTWKDMAEIVKIANRLEIEWLNNTPWDGIRDWGFYTEVLKRFKKQKVE